MPHDPSEVKRKYLANMKTMIFHLVSSSFPACQPAVTDTVGYSDSAESLVKNNIYPCRWCLKEIGEEEVLDLLNREVRHDTIRVG